MNDHHTIASRGSRGAAWCAALAAACLAAGCAAGGPPLPGDTLAGAPAAVPPGGPLAQPKAGPDAGDARRIVRATRRHAQRVALAWPADGPVVAGFQPGRNRGIEIAVRSGEPVRAAADGRVMYAGTGLNDYGSLVIVQHSADILTAYARSGRLLVKTGDIVRQGEPIAQAGAPDRARDAAVCFEVRRDGKPVDPVAYLPPRQG
ncbi:murein hydrolase activator EnvC family protein [Burkholderia glumae]|uniref:Peptidoglycan DD-metalloendopeptidase family protein n=1 Tax=Burkholderia glumae TaxID=337 RepID=A0AAP9XWB8_BURGL|nr:Putative peptidoglycan-binding LysM/M23B peptidase [Burkholderia glumae BGR1]AJY63537.1 peptidase M23 family protein [Burkholderia glumae LMG 2196 = ATCC 33617]PNL05962.1 peptidoglycan-binding protein [Burkholderia glumae]QKM56356.1 Murein hydrolase activator NlpD [Burkholderia glumae]QPQ89821.1 peptidoglycan DD-metalloendopeptidase family protein [Burkholderia glumae]